jgi:U3 small nucleolar RNA-associated protein 3
MYLLLKVEQCKSNKNKVVDPALIQSHPVMLHLQKLNSFASKIELGVEQKVSGLKEQLETLVKAAESLDAPDGGVSDDESHASNESNDDDGNDVQNEEMFGTDSSMKQNLRIVDAQQDVGEMSKSDSDDDSSVDEDAARRTMLTEARFGLRPNDMKTSHPNEIKISQRNHMKSDAGDEDTEDIAQIKKIGQTLATTLNSIVQRTATQQQRKKGSTQQLVEHLDEPNDDDDGELRRGLEMMEAELGKTSDDEKEMDEDAYDPELDSEYDNMKDDFYSNVSKKSKAMKEDKKKRYSVAPKFPRVETEIVGERAINKQILKNRGLVAHKAKINRNPRVKQREKYRKAIIRRKGAVRDVRTGEGHMYGGEQTGIKTNISHSRKLV